ncbi:MAG: FAD-dependent oxidoreductase [Tepidibacillus sp.]
MKKNLNIKTETVKYEYDVIVIGVEVEGIAAAIAVARNGADSLFIEKRDGLGGLFTYGRLNQLRSMLYRFLAKTV